MSRYRTLRTVGCGPFAAAAIVFVNWLTAVPPNEIRFMHMTIEIDDVRAAAAIDAQRREK